MDTQSLMQLLGQRIKEKRIELGLTMEELAERSDSPVDVIKELEWSTLKDIDISTLLAIAAAVEESVSDLVTDKRRLAN